MTPFVTPDPRFRAWLVERAPRLAPPDLLDRAVQAATARPQANAWAVRLPVLRFATLIAASVALVAAIGIAVILWPPPTAILDPSPSVIASAVAEPTPSPTVVPTPIPSWTATAGPTAIATSEPITAFQAWTRVDMPDPAPDFLGGGTPVGIVRLGDRYVAVGSVRSSNPRAVTWTSSDGRTWELHDDPSGLSAVSVADLVTDGARILALGQRIGATECCPSLAAWVSMDGNEWTVVDAEAPSLAAGGSSGFVGAFVEGNSVQFRRSPDGSRWSDASTSFRADVADLAITASGEAMAVGHITVDRADGEGYATHIVSWHSGGGSRWDEREVLARNAVARSIVAGPRGFVIVGHQTIDRVDGSVFDTARIWRVTGTGLSTDSIDFAPGQSLDRVFRIGDDLIATGIEVTELGDRVIAWQSSDGGEHWVPIPGQRSLEGSVTTVAAMASGQDGFVAVGHGLDPESGHLVPVAWIAPR